MLFDGFYDKMLFLALICSSVFAVLIPIGRSKNAPMFKLMGWTFLLPLSLCFANFIVSTNTPAGLVLSFSELCLSALIFILLLRAPRNKSLSLYMAAIAVLALIAATYSVKAGQFVYYTMSAAVRNTITLLLIAASIIHIYENKADQNLIPILSIWFFGILLMFFKDRPYAAELASIVRVGAYCAFAYYFYSTTFNAFINKTKQLEQTIEAMEHSLNKEIKKRVIEIEKSNERLLEISKTDMLTKTYNKAAILSIIDKLIVSSKKDSVFSILMFDIDNFKIINDTLGHVTGDMCLKALANIAACNIRDDDYLGRYGGDEFIIVLPNLAQNEARFVAERFRKKVIETSNPKLTVSIGIATYPFDGRTVQDLVSAADQGLYRSKSGGKNMVSHASQF